MTKSPYQTAVQIDDEQDEKLLEFLFALERSRIWLNRWEHYFVTEQLHRRRVLVPKEFVMHFTPGQRDSITRLRQKYGARITSQEKTHHE